MFDMNSTAWRVYSTEYSGYSLHNEDGPAIEIRTADVNDPDKYYALYDHIFTDKTEWQKELDNWIAK